MGSALVILFSFCPAFKKCSIAGSRFRCMKDFHFPKIRIFTSNFEPHGNR